MDATPPLRSRFRGCFLGGAVGDALGAPVEFLTRDQILDRYGPGGIRDMDVAYGVRGAITDDTQMTLFTAEGLIRADARSLLRGASNPVWVMKWAYLRWLATQGEHVDDFAVKPEHQGWLFQDKRLHSRRAPGNTCLSALRNPNAEALEAQNNSKGCGGVMRIAPVGLATIDPFGFGCRFAQITHGHPLGTITAGSMAVMVSRLKEGDALEAAVHAGIEVVHDYPELADLLRRAVHLAHASTSPEAGVAALGEGWVAEESLAIAVFCALRATSFEEAIVMAVNHSGDSDSTGSIAGQLLGTLLGEEAIPARWLNDLELRDVITQVADDLYDWFVTGVVSTKENWPTVSEEWYTRYPGC